MTGVAILVILGCAWTQDEKRSEEVVRHDDGTVTVRVRALSLSVGELAQLLGQYGSEGGTVRVVGSYLLVRDTPAKIAEMEKIAAAFDVPPQPVEIVLEVAWKGAEFGASSRVVTLRTVLDRDFRSAGTEEKPYPAEILEHPGGVNATKRYRPTGIVVSGKALRRGGNRLDVQLRIEITRLLPDQKFATEQFELTTALENGKAKTVSAASSKGADPKSEDALSVGVTATLK